jgi:hypothetical protein
MLYAAIVPSSRIQMRSSLLFHPIPMRLPPSQGIEEIGFPAWLHIVIDFVPLPLLTWSFGNRATGPPYGAMATMYSSRFFSHFKL